MSGAIDSPLLPQPATPRKDYSSLISALSNLSIQYNLSVVAIALMIMDPMTNDDDQPIYPRTESQDSLIKSSVFAGAVAGQAIMGGLGDIIGR